MNIKYLNNLAEIIVSIDEGKNITDANIVSFTDRGLRLIGQMRRLGLDVGTLQEILAGMQLMCGNRVTKLKFDRDGFVEALASWMRWRGHSIPHNMLSQRFPLASGEVALSALQKASRAVGVHITFKKRKKVLPKPENFPLLALMKDGTVAAVRQMDMQGRMLSSQVGGEPCLMHRCTPVI